MLGLHIQAWQPGALDSVLRAKGAVLKVMAPDVGPIQTVLEQRPDTVIVCRRYFSDDEQRQRLAAGYMGGHETADDVYHTFFEILRLARQMSARIYVEGLNEIGLWNDAANYNQFTVGFSDRCMETGLKPAVYSFATGNPPGYGLPDGSVDLASYWAHYLEGLRAAKRAGGALALHEYSAPSMRDAESWLCLRYRRVYDVLPDDLKDLPLLITECGIDGGVLGAPSAAAAGWRNYATPEQYAAQLAWYDGELAKDPQVLGATVFTAGNADMWGSFDVTGVDPVLDAIAAGAPQGGTTVPKPTTITPANRPSGQPGGEAVFEFDAKGVDGTAKGFADVSHALIPGTDHSYYGPNMTTELPPFRDGHNTVTLKIPPATTPIPAGGTVGDIRFRLFELDGAEWDGGIHGPWPIDIVAEAQTPAAPQPGTQPPVGTVPIPPLGILPAEYDTLWKLAGDLAGYANDTDDALAVYFQQVIKWRKGEPDGINPFVKKPATPK